MKNAVVLTGWYESPENNWYQWVRQQYSHQGYEAEVPDLPTMNSDMPSLETQMQFLKENDLVNSETTLIGHSLGALLSMRVAEQQRVDKLVLVAGWDFDDLTEEHQLFWTSKIDHTAVKENTNQIYVLHSDNDPYITAFHAEEMAKRLEAKFILLKGYGHFMKRDGIVELPEAVI